MENKERFEYSYSSQQQDEIRKIREKYQPQKEDRLTRVRRLDERVTRKATIVSLMLGIVGILVFGTGMSLIMVANNVFFVLGIIVGIIGIACIACAYPVYAKILRIERAKVASEILRLTEELMK